MRSTSTLVGSDRLTPAPPQAAAMTAVLQSPVSRSGWRAGLRPPTPRFAELSGRLPANADCTQTIARGDLHGDLSTELPNAPRPTRRGSR